MSRWLDLARGQTGLSELSEHRLARQEASQRKDMLLPAELPSGANGAIGTPPLIPAGEIRSSLDWITHQLISNHGRGPERAGRDALAILRSNLLNDARLLPPQVDKSLCLMCGDPDAPAAPLVPVLTPIDGEHRWVHLDACHQAYIAELAARVDSLLKAAGLTGELL